MIDIVEEELSRPTIFRDESKLSSDYIPPQLPHREKEQRQLAQIFKALIEKEVSQIALITGSIGTGKTVVAKKFGEEFTKVAQRRNIKIDYVHTNCRQWKTTFSVMHSILKTFIPTIQTRGYSVEELLDTLLDYFESQNRFLILALDELDYFVSRNGPDLVYTLCRSAETSRLTKQRLSLIGIVRDLAFRQGLDLATLSTLKENIVYLQKYNASQLQDILKFRAEEAFHLGVLHGDVLPLIADIASEWGDARYALELLWRAGKLADGFSSTLVLPEYVRQAKAETHPEIREEILRELDFQEKLLLLTIVRYLKNTKRAYAFTGEIIGSYRVVCEEYNETPRSHTQVWEYLKELEKNGIITTALTGEGKRGNSSQISLPDVPAAVLEQKLTQLLLEGKNG